MSIEKQKLYKNILERTKTAGVLLTNPANMRYVAGFTGEGYVFVSEDENLVVTDSRYTIQTKKECENFQVIEWGKIKYYQPLCQAIDKIAKAKSLNKIIIGIEDMEMTLNEFEKLRDYAIKNTSCEIEFCHLKDSISKFRQIKNKKELEIMKEAEAIGDRAFSRIIKKIKKGMTEKQVAALIEYYMKDEGAEGFSFETIAASGLNSAMPHAVPSDKKLEEGDFLTMDFGCIYKGYCSDMTRTVVIGKASDRQKEIYELVKKAQENAIKNLKAKMTGREIDALARDIINDAGYGRYFGHSLGHSVGLEIHERPGFTPKEEQIIEEGMTITVEPGIYIEGFGGVRIEDLVIVTKDGNINITNSTKELIEII